MADIERAELLRTWVAALRTGKYQKCLYRTRSSGSFCALGVLDDVAGAGRDYDGSEALWGPDWYHFAKPISTLNDDGFSFPELANFIEATHPDVFGEKVDRGEGVEDAYLGADASALELVEA